MELRILTKDPQESGGTGFMNACMVFACHAHPGFASARSQGRSRFIEDSEEVEAPAGDSRRW
jgi:hypothetical protein